MEEPTDPASAEIAPPPVPKDAEVPAAPKAVPRPLAARKPSLWNGVKDAALKAADTVGAYTAKTTAKLGTESFYPTSLDLECRKAARILRTFTMDAVDLPDEALEDVLKTGPILRKIPPTAISHCHGLAIFTIMRTGLLTTGAGGSGVLIARLPDGSWSGASGILLHTLGFGLITGPDVYDVVLVLRTTKAVQSLTIPRATLGGEVSMENGPVGSATELEGGVEAAPIWCYVKTKGEHNPIRLDGNTIIERREENERCYGRPITASRILSGEVEPAYWAQSLIQTILAAEGKDFDLDKIPTGSAPADFIGRRGSLLDERRASIQPFDPTLRGPAPLSEELEPVETSESDASLSEDPAAATSAAPSRTTFRPSFIQIPSLFSRTDSKPVEKPLPTPSRRLAPEELDEDDLAARREMEEAMRQFGIEDPTINQSLRQEDPLLLQGSDLDMLSTPPLSNPTSPESSRDSSILCPVSPFSLKYTGAAGAAPTPPLTPMGQHFSLHQGVLGVTSPETLSLAETEAGESASKETDDHVEGAEPLDVTTPTGPQQAEEEKAKVEGEEAVTTTNMDEVEGTVAPSDEQDENAVAPSTPTAESGAPTFPESAPPVGEEANNSESGSEPQSPDLDGEFGRRESVYEEAPTFEGEGDDADDFQEAMGGLAGVGEESQ